MISSSLNSVHDSNTGNGRGKPSSRSLSLNSIFSLSKTFLMEIEKPEVGMQFLHLVGNSCTDVGSLK